MDALLPAVKMLARSMALLGGIVLTALIALICVSVVGRSLNTLGHSDWLVGLAPGLSEWLLGTGVGPVPGDFELVEAGIAFSLFAFLPICQLNGAHATVDVFTSRMPRRLNQFLIAFWEVVLALVVLVICWRLGIGLTEKFENQETTFLLQFPIWWAYAASFAAAFVAALVSVFSAIARVFTELTGRIHLPESTEADH